MARDLLAEAVDEARRRIRQPSSGESPHPYFQYRARIEWGHVTGLGNRINNPQRKSGEQKLKS